MGFPGERAAVGCSLVPASRGRVGLFRVTPVTGTVRGATVTLHSAVLLPSAVVTVMVVLPAPTAMTFPLSSTVAAAGLLDVQVTALLAAFSGRTVAVSRAVSPSFKDREV